MNIQHRLSLLFTAITAALFLGFCAVIYLTAASNRSKEFISSLQKEAITKANVLLEAGVHATTLQTIYRQNREVLNEVEVAIYNTSLDLIYHDAVDIDFVKETPQMLAQIHQEGFISFQQEEWQVIGIKHDFKGEFYLITAAAFDEYGFNKLNNLKQTLLLSFLVSLLLIYFLGRYFSKKALQPVVDMTGEARKISATNLDLRIKEGNGQDELAQLAITFNEMLSRLENSFEAQKSVVSNLAHELRTPLSAMMTELSWAIEKERPSAELKKSVEDALLDARKMNRIITALLDLAKASYDQAQIAFQSVRVDEILLEARADVLKANPGYLVSIHLAEMKEKHLNLNANAYLLRTAFYNLMENACKYSEDQSCQVSIEKNQSSLLIIFTDNGAGIEESDLEMIFKPFYRGKNSKVQGTGIGLSLVQKIINLHHGDIHVKSQPGHGTQISLRVGLETKI